MKKVLLIAGLLCLCTLCSSCKNNSKEAQINGFEERTEEWLEETGQVRQEESEAVTFDEKEYLEVESGSVASTELELKESSTQEVYETENYGKTAEVVEEVAEELSHLTTTDLYKIDNINGYTLYTYRPLGAILRVENGEYSEVVSDDEVVRDARYHWHCDSPEEQDSVYFYEDNGCSVEEDLTVSVYSKKAQEKLYGDGEFSEWLDNLGKTLRIGNYNLCHKVEYKAPDKDWVAYFMESDLDKEPSENDSKILSLAYTKEGFGNNITYVTVELAYKDSSLSYEERLNGAKESLKCILQTIQKIDD